ncbi:hypothetical protein PLESTB_001339800 [Pleodorina starrii]|uniref:Uncharacterized protein n=1 Tax=Pleodorina starrii TaxID=330485 RepID=A0A9W6BU91_9CHLO|nr:hypothetical protein PLESTB_001339800 [Pleodorina starrii]GLC66384.1 hypothetical protein PLESTF_000421600 [Pleodorina starrii]
MDGEKRSPEQITKKIAVRRSSVNVPFAICSLTTKPQSPLRRKHGARGGGRRGGGDLDGEAGDEHGDLVRAAFMWELRELGVATVTPAAIQQAVKTNRHCEDASSRCGCPRGPGNCVSSHATSARLVAGWLGVYVGQPDREGAGGQGQ